MSETLKKPILGSGSTGEEVICSTCQGSRGYVDKTGTVVECTACDGSGKIRPSR